MRSPKAVLAALVLLFLAVYDLYGCSHVRTRPDPVHTVKVRRAAAVALEQEMTARVAEMRARVVEAEAQVPLAMAQAFREGNLETIRSNGN